MSGTSFTESDVEEAALAWLESIGWRVAHGPDIAPDMPAAERADSGEAVLSLVQDRVPPSARAKSRDLDEGTPA